MTRTSKSKKRSSQTYQNKLSNWNLLFLGILIGVFLAGLIYLKGFHGVDHAKEDNAQKKVALKKNRTEAATANRVAAQPRFDFYTLLPKMNVSVPDEKNQNQNRAVDESAPTKPTVTQEANKNIQKIFYIVQMASFQDFKEADELKAQLTLMGYEVKTSSIKAKDKLWHRVFIGPFTNQKLAEKTQQQLHSQHVSSVIVKMTS